MPYRDQKTSQQFGNQSARANQARDSYRGRTETGSFNSANRGNASPSAQQRSNSGSFNQGQRSPANSGARPSSFDGVDRGGASAKAASQRGQTSRSSSASSGSRSGGSRSGGGGGSRGGGGGGRGGGGGGGRGRSDVALKDNFVSVDPAVTLQRLMQLPISTWNYKDDPETRHLGPMAQDFYRSFGIGSDDKTITFLDEGGVALSAIQGLSHRIDERDAKVEALEKEVARLRALVEELTRRNGAEAASSKP